MTEKHPIFSNSLRDMDLERALMSKSTTQRDVVLEKMSDAQTPGFRTEFTPDEAERAGAFAEDALSEQDAAESSSDLIELTDMLEPLEDDGSSDSSQVKR
jgi:hypothetical protein